MEFLKVILRGFSHRPLRTALTSLGVAVALFAFVMIRTIINAWYSGVEASAKDRLIVRNAASLIFYLPVSYHNSIKSVPDVLGVEYGNWFGGIYKDETFRFQQFAVSRDYVELYPEYSVDESEKQAWKLDRTGILVGEEIAKTTGIKVGDRIQLKGTVFPGMWQFNVRGIFRAKDGKRDTRLMYFHWDYLNERNRIELAREPDHAGFFVVQLRSGANAAEVAKAIDERFANSYAETLTETETAFVQGFISMSASIIMVLNIVSGVVIVIMLLVLANTMLMSFRERYTEFSVLKALGFEIRQLSLLIIGEGAMLGLLGMAILLVLLIPFFVIPTKSLLGSLTNFFPVFEILPSTLVFALLLSLAAGLLASTPPLISMVRLRVTEGLRRIE